MMGSEQIAMLVYPGFTALDLVGPHFFLSGLMGAKVHLVTNQPTLAPVVSDAGLAVTPSAHFQDLPAELDVIFVPGGFQGTLEAMTSCANAWISEIGIWGRDPCSERLRRARSSCAACPDC